MELRHLRYFLALANTLNFTRAAERVHITQSTLSHQINQLEEEIGFKLFERDNKIVLLTAAGESFLLYTSRALSEIDRGLSFLKDSNQEFSGFLRIGATPTANLRILPNCISALLNKHPNVKIIVEELSGEDIINQLQNNELDLGITYRPNNKKGLKFEPLFDDDLVFVASKTHHLAHRKRLRVAELNGEKLALLSTRFSTRQFLSDFFQEARADPNVVVEMNSVPAILALVATTNIGAIVARSSLLRPELFSVIILEGPTPVRTHGLVFPKGTQSPIVHAASVLIRKEALKIKI